MDYTTLKNLVFSKYYFNSYLPGTLGAFEASTIFNYLLTLESMQENLITEMNRTKHWIDTIPTWYTNQLPQLFFIPRFSNESDQEYLDRLLLLTDIGQNDGTITIAVFSVVEKALTGISRITIVEQLDGISALWDDDTNLDPDNDPPDDVERWDGNKVWSSLIDVQRTLFLVDIEILNRGSDLDITTWDYWRQSENYTKIQDMVKLYKPPGSTFELRLNIPENVTQLITDVFSNTKIQWEGIHKVSDTSIYVAP